MGGSVAHYYSSLKDNCNNYSKKLQISKNKNVYHFYAFDKKNYFFNCFLKKTFELVYEYTAMTSFLKENIRISLRVHCNDFFSKRKYLN